MIRIRRTTVATVLAVGMLALVAGPAVAHVTANPNTAVAGGRAATTLVVPHGCDGSPTVAVEVAIPDEVDGVTPEQVAGWDVEVTDESVTWTAEPGGALPEGQFRGFGLRLVLPDTPGEVLWLPTIQTCEDGESAWIEIPDDLDGWGDLDHPAPYLELTAGEGDGHGAGASPTDEGSEHEDADGGQVDDADGSDDAEELDTELTASEDTGTGALVYVALAVGVLGAALGAAGLATARKRG